MPISLAGPSSKNRSSVINNEFTQNFYIEFDKKSSALHPFPGCKAFHSNPLDTEKDRGMTVFKDELYKLSGEIFYKIDSSGNSTVLGSIPGNGRVIFANDGVDLFIATGSTPYVFNTALSTISDTDFENPTSVAYINSQVAVDGTGSRYGISDVLDIDSIDSLNYATASASPGDLLRVYVFEDFLYLFCSDNTERWYNSGVGNPPFDRIDGGSIRVGLGAVYSVANTDTFVYFLGDDKRVYRLRASTEEAITTSSISNQIESFNDISDAIGFSFTIQGQSFYLLSFPSANKTFLYSENYNSWTNLAYGVNGARHLANSYAFCYGKHLVSDYRNGSVYELDIDTYTDNSEVIQRIRVLPNLTGDLLSAPGQRLLMRKLEIVIERGVGNSDEQDPQIMVEFSADAGKSWRSLQYIKAGRSGEFLSKLDYDLMSSFYEGSFRITTSDPNFFSLKSASAWVKPYGY